VQDQGRQERRFWLLGGRDGCSELPLDRRAEELQTPAEYVMDSDHHGTEAWERSFLEIMPSNVWALAIKRPENEKDGVIVRVQERSGRATQATFKSTLLGLDHVIDLGPWDLKTLLLKRAEGRPTELREVSLLEI
jgi:alpha-mannosidase